jgi:hypothetical protein
VEAAGDAKLSIRDAKLVFHPKALQRAGDMFFRYDVGL